MSLGADCPRLRRLFGAYGDILEFAARGGPVLSLISALLTVELRGFMIISASPTLNVTRLSHPNGKAGPERRTPSWPNPRQQRAPRTFVKGVHGVRYQVKDVARAIAFYTNHLGFNLERQQLPAFANVSLGDAQILLSGPGASGSRPMPNGATQQPGGWNRVVLKVDDLLACVTALKEAGIHFRNEMETGPSGRQIQIEDPDGNPIELFEPAR